MISSNKIFKILIPTSILMFIFTIFVQSKTIGLITCLIYLLFTFIFFWNYHKKNKISDFIFPFFQSILLVNLSLGLAYISYILYLPQLDYLSLFHMGIQYSLGISYFVSVIALSNIFYMNTIFTKFLIIGLNLLSLFISYLLYLTGMEALATLTALTSLLMFYFLVLGFLLTYNKTTSLLAIIINIQAIIFSYLFIKNNGEFVINTLNQFHK